MVYGARLESVLGLTALEGSNPSPSANYIFKLLDFFWYKQLFGIDSNN